MNSTRPTTLFALLALAASAPVLFHTPPAYAGPPIMVNDIGDAVGTDGLCTLPEAINNANTKSDTTGGDCRAGKGKTVTIDITTLVGEEIYLTALLPEITGNMAIEGPGAPYLTVSGDDNRRIFTVNGGELEISGVRLSNGLTAAGAGAGISVLAGGILTLTEVILDDNYPGTTGGAIYIDSSTADIRHSTFFHNTAAAGDGSVIANLNGTVTVMYSAFFDNRAGSSGGAIASIASGTGRSASLSVHQSTLFDNEASAVDGGAIATRAEGGGAATTIITDCTVAENRAPGGEGGGINNDAESLSTAITAITDSVVFKNTALVGLSGDINNEGAGTALLTVQNTFYLRCTGCP